MKHRIIFAAAIAALAVSSPATAQGLLDSTAIEAYAGLTNDAYDISPDGERMGFLVGARISHPIAPRVRGVLNLGYGETNNVSNPGGLEDYFLYDNLWIHTTIGAELDVITGPTSLAAGFQAGAGWRKNHLYGEQGNPDWDTESYSHNGYAALEMLVPSVTLRHDFKPVAISLSVEDRIFDVFEGPLKHNPGISLGVSVPARFLR